VVRSIAESEKVQQIQRSKGDTPGRVAGGAKPGVAAP
jgi:hypothetical protein